MNVGILLPGFSSDEDDWAIPVQLNLVREMAKNDDVRVVTLRYPHRRDQYSVFEAEVHSLGVGAWTRGVRRLKLWWNAIRLIRRLHKDRPFDVLHAMWADETGLIAGWAGRLLNIPVVVSIAGGELVGFEDIGYGLQNSRFSRWTVGQALRHASAVVVACEYARQLITSAGYRIPQEKIYTITLGVDTTIFTPHPENHIPNRLIHVASLIGIKDQATLLNAIALLDDVTLDVIGTGKNEIQLRTLAQQLNIHERVNFIGAINHLDLPEYYRHAQLNLLTSRHEGLGMVTLEAGACGIPTVSTNIGLLPDYPELGMCVPVGDSEALAQAIKSLLDDQERHQALSQSALKIVQNQFTIQHTVDHFRRLYTEQINFNH